MDTFTSTLCPSCPAIRVGNDVLKPITIMKSGVFNGAKKDVDALRASTRLWDGKDILLYVNAEGIYDHPPEGISTKPEYIVGKIENPFWEEDRQRIRAVAHFYADKAPPWIIEKIENNEPLGVSGAFFCEKVPERGTLDGVEFSFIERKYVPNNAAIVSNPACELPFCGINTNGEDKLVENDTSNKVEVPTVDGTRSVPLENLTINVNMPKLEEVKMSEEDTKKLALEAELNTQKQIVVEKDQLIATKDAEILKITTELNTLKEEKVKIETQAKTDKFLSQFPEVNREKAKTELLPVFLENPAELVLNAAKMQSLMFVDGKPAGEAKEFVPVPETNSEDKVFDDLGVVSKDEMKKRFGL